MVLLDSRFLSGQPQQHIEAVSTEIAQPLKLPLAHGEFRPVQRTTDSCLECDLHGVSAHIDCPIEALERQKNPRILEASSGETVKVGYGDHECKLTWAASRLTEH